MKKQILKTCFLLIVVLLPVSVVADCPSDLMALGTSGPLAEYICKGKFHSGTDLPSTCEVGEMFFDTDDDACSDANDGDGVICFCEAADTWAVVKDV